MSRELVSCDIKIPKFEEMLMQQIGRIQIAIASDIQTNIAQRFNNQGAFNGHERWKDLKTGLNLKKAGNGLKSRQVLKKTGALKNSIAPQAADGQAGPEGYVQFSGDLRTPVVKVGTRIKYARIHNDGGVIEHPGTQHGFGVKGKVYKARKNKRRHVGRGLTVGPYQIKIPKRNFTDWNATDNDNLQKTLKNTIEEILNGR
jgi:phage gpG-like protein